MIDYTKLAKCRGCGRALDGPAYYLGGWATLPETGERACINFYGGYVCSYQCDVKVCLDMERNMPGAGVNKRISDPSRKKIRDNWGGRK